MMFHLQNCRSYVRSVFNQTDESGFLLPADIDFALNEAYMTRSMDLIEGAQGYFETTKSIDIVANQEAYALPSLYNGDPDFVRAVMIERVLSDRTIPMAHQNRYNESNLTVPVSAGDAYIPDYRFRGRNFILEPTPADNITAGVKLTYSFMPPRLRCSTATGGASTTITLDSSADPRDNYYKNCRIFIISGTGAGQNRVISSYVGATHIATVSVAWTTNPDSTSVFSTLFYDDFPEMAHELVCLDASMSSFIKERASGEVMSAAASLRQAKLQKMFTAIFDVRTDQAKFTRLFHPELM